jgi:hypothetical protein
LARNVHSASEKQLGETLDADEQAFPSAVSVFSENVVVTSRQLRVPQAVQPEVQQNFYFETRS